MKILLALGSRLLSDALHESLSNCKCMHNSGGIIEVIVPSNGNSPKAWMDSDVIVADYISLTRVPKDCFDHSKVIVIDNGLEKETVASLFLTENIAGVVHIESDIKMLCKAIRTVHNGEVWIDNHTIRTLLNKSISRTPNNRAKLSEREIAIVKLVREGYRNKELASVLSISEQTVKSHLNRIFRKMGVSSRAELISRLSNKAGSCA